VPAADGDVRAVDDGLPSRAVRVRRGDGRARTVDVDVPVVDGDVRAVDGDERA
jgi:hypothetical protein